MNESWHKEQAERDEKLIAYWQEKLADYERGVETAKRQIEYLGSLAMQHSLERKGEQWAEQRDNEDHIIRGEN